MSHHTTVSREHHSSSPHSFSFGTGIDLVIGLTATALAGDQLLRAADSENHHHHHHHHHHHDQASHLAAAGLSAAAAAGAFNLLYQERKDQKRGQQQSDDEEARRGRRHHRRHDREESRSRSRSLKEGQRRARARSDEAARVTAGRPTRRRSPESHGRPGRSRSRSISRGRDRKSLDDRRAETYWTYGGMDEQREWSRSRSRHDPNRQKVEETQAALPAADSQPDTEFLFQRTPQLYAGASPVKSVKFAEAK